ncbi:MAG TPA: hypothetical protein P5149_14450 [Candidatus Competibacteraceae bacterium]|nr:hypothetical protein [Candidatus Competibacteraceae bacterium]MCP5133151.1 hypothetical protein [Gammaproteobacteria bacterium]HPF60184.1 hypothetical protein [Candidatus Competibacteraceae bacterium]HRY19589.1 hypothetical protein [Candidatus Competibacteraceae bacterium]
MAHIGLTAEATRLQTAIGDHMHQHPGLPRKRDGLHLIPPAGEKTAQ